jgi:hypothetical protein
MIHILHAIIESYFNEGRYLQIVNEMRLLQVPIFDVNIKPISILKTYYDIYIMYTQSLIMEEKYDHAKKTLSLASLVLSSYAHRLGERFEYKVKQDRIKINSTAVKLSLVVDYYLGNMPYLIEYIGTDPEVLVAKYYYLIKLGKKMKLRHICKKSSATRSIKHN